MDAIREYLSMGGYAVFIWPAFGVTALIMVGLLFGSVRSLRRERQTLELMEAARPRRRERSAASAKEHGTKSKGSAAGEA